MAILVRCGEAGFDMRANAFDAGRAEAFRATERLAAFAGSFGEGRGLVFLALGNRLAAFGEGFVGFLGIPEGRVLLTTNMSVTEIQCSNA